MNPARPTTVALLLALPLATLSASRIGAAEPARLDPAKTFAVIVGVLRWEDKGMTTFSTRHRKDRELADLLKARGVPAGNVRLLLDDEATLSNIRRDVREVAAKAGEDSTFLFYYAGHGHRNGDGMVMANFDIKSGKDDTGLDAAGVGQLLAKHFKGGRVFLFADCCHSGGLSAAARSLANAEKPAAVVASADQMCGSTGNWTFSQALIDCLRGDPLCDRDGDGNVTLSELESEVAAAMKHRETQRYGRTGGIDGGFILAPRSGPKPASPAGKFAIGDYVHAKRASGEQPARVVGRQGEQFLVQFYDYSDKKDKLLAEKDLRPFEYPIIKVGQTVMNTIDGKKRGAKVLEVSDDFCRIRYRQAALPDEWVLSSDLRVPTDPAEADSGGKLVEVEWKGTWYPAEILKEEKARFRIHYVGYGPEWDEWVGPDRVREVKAAKKE